MDWREFCCVLFTVYVIFKVYAWLKSGVGRGNWQLQAAGIAALEAGWDRACPGFKPNNEGKFNRNVVKGSITVSPSMADIHGNVHTSAIFTLADGLTTVAVGGSGAFPGVSVNLSVTMLNPAKVGTELQVTATLIKAGRTLAFTECEFHYIDGTGAVVPVAYAKHIKFVALPGSLASLVWGTCHRLPYEWGSSIICWGLGQGSIAQKKKHLAIPDFRTDDSKRLDEKEYLDKIGTPSHFFVGFDAWVNGITRSESEGVLEMTCTGNHTNVSAGTHGGALAMLMDIGTRVAASHAGLPTSLKTMEVEYIKATRPGQKLEVEAKVLPSEDKASATVHVSLYSCGGCSGTSTKTLIARGVMLCK